LRREYHRRLAALFSGAAPPQIAPLLSTYKTIASATPKPAIDDVLLAKLQATQKFKDNEVLLWRVDPLHSMVT